MTSAARQKKTPSVPPSKDASWQNAQTSELLSRNKSTNSQFRNTSLFDLQRQPETSWQRKRPRRLSTRDLLMIWAWGSRASTSECRRTSSRPCPDGMRRDRAGFRLNWSPRRLITLSRPFLFRIRSGDHDRRRLIRRSTRISWSIPRFKNRSEEAQSEQNRPPSRPLRQKDTGL